jgi:branched-chain amino acid transport system ATP-binding protein
VSDLLDIKGVNAGYGRIHVLFDIDAKIKEKCITVLVGPNGSGKSTLLKTIMGITQIYSGEIIFDAKGITGLSPHIITKRGITYLPQVNNVFANLKVRENLTMAGYLLSKEEASKRVEEALEDFPIIKGYLNKKAGMLSGGERQMLAMAMAMIKRPKVMLFDEPTASLAPIIAFEVLDKILELKDNYGITAILAEQNAKRALEHGDAAILLVSGKVMYEGGSADLLNHEELGKVYLGIKTG